MSSTLLDMSMFDQSKVEQTFEMRSRSLEGESYIIDWSHTKTKAVKEACVDLSGRFRNRLGGDFASIENFHSTILSKRLHRDDSAGARKRTWIDTDYACCEAFFHRVRPRFRIRLESCVVADTGTVQLVFRDTRVLPVARRFLELMGATVKPGTTEGDRINTCTVVLGYLKRVPAGTNAELMHILIQEIAEWREKHPGLEVPIRIPEISLVEYHDLSLNSYVTVRRFR